MESAGKDNKRKINGGTPRNGGAGFAADEVSGVDALLYLAASPNGASKKKRPIRRNGDERKTLVDDDGGSEKIGEDRHGRDERCIKEKATRRRKGKGHWDSGVKRGTGHSAIERALSSAAVRKFCRYEFFHPDIDEDFMQRGINMDTLGTIAGLRPGSPVSKAEKCALRSVLTSPRRFSKRFLLDARKDMYRMRHMKMEYAPGVEYFVGREVTAVHPPTTELVDGVILTNSQKSCRIQFHDKNLGTHLVEKQDILLKQANPDINVRSAMPSPSNVQLPGMKDDKVELRLDLDFNDQNESALRELKDSVHTMLKDFIHMQERSDCEEGIKSLLEILKQGSTKFVSQSYTNIYASKKPIPGIDPETVDSNAGPLSFSDATMGLVRDMLTIVLIFLLGNLGVDLDTRNIMSKFLEMEPFSALDSTLREQMTEAIKDIVSLCP